VLPQVWLALVNLLVEPACRAKYEIDDYRCAGVTPTVGAVCGGGLARQRERQAATEKG
jgi:hypothetical protein